MLTITRLLQFFCRLAKTNLAAELFEKSEASKTAIYVLTTEKKVIAPMIHRSIMLMSI